MDINIIKTIIEWFSIIGDPAIVYSYGYVGVFISSLAGSFLLFTPMPFFFIVYVAGIVLDPTLVAITSTFGATIAKVTIFKTAGLGKKFIGQKTKNRLKPFERLSYKYGWFAAFLAALTPIPDDLVYVPLGLIGYNLWRFIAATFTGKLIFTLMITWGARLSFPWINLLIGAAPNKTYATILSALIIITGILILYLIVKLDWEKILEKWYPWTVKNIDEENK